ncbi:MAG TPA: hypothetical protein VHB54_11450 [Mucilaginibacter sp.]|nr:hypothetical protein [Mucilaginibacter sp.]
MLKKHLKSLVVLLAIMFGVSRVQLLFAQDMNDQLRVVNRSLSGREGGSVHLDEVGGDGLAWLNGKSFTTGTIEFDIKGKDKMQGSFVGFAFHGVNDSTYEAIYFRPFNFRSADPVRKGHAIQYVASPKYDWSVLREKFPSKYEQAVSPAPDPNGWFHVRIVVESEKISVYVNGNSNPALVVAPLVKTGGKTLGYWVGNTSGGDWKNLKIENGEFR